MKLSCQETLVSGENFAEKLKKLESYGFDGVELYGGYLEDASGFAERKVALADSPVRASSICGGYPLHLVHPDPACRQATIDGLKRQLDYAAELGALGPIMVPIFSSEPRVPDLTPLKTRAELEGELLLAMLREVIPHAESLGCAILLEPLNRYESDSLPHQADGARVVRALSTPAVRLMSDTFHMNTEEFNIAQTIRDCGDAIGHVHLADSTRKEPGSGSIDFRSIFKALREVGFNGYMALE